VVTEPIALSNVPGVELVRTGQWSASTGVSTITRDDLAQAVAAMACPAVRDPVIKLGHTDPRFDGQPAVGRVTNMSVANDCSLVGDLTGMPGWLGPVLASAYPSRSIEGQWNYRCSVGHVHPFVITGLALLGAAEPAIGSLDDIAELWSPTTEVTMGKKIAAAATVEDIRRAYYDTADWDLWIEEIQLDPLQLIVVNDNDGCRSRVPITINPGADGSDAVVFGDPVPVVVRYDDVSEPAAPVGDSQAVVVAASSLRFASRAESRRDFLAAEQRKESAAMADTITPANPGGLTDEQMTAIRGVLGLTEDADPDMVVAGLLALTQKVQNDDEADDAEDAADGGADEAAEGEATTDAQKVAASKPGTVTVDAEKWAEVQEFMAAARRRDQADAEKRADDMVDAAFKAGKIGRTSVAQYKTLARANYADTKTLLDSIAASAAFPVDELGHGVDRDTEPNVRDNAVYKTWEV
jgi:hypothetical protein